jgi:predicted AAA+ superfamily ATPase
MENITKPFSISNLAKKLHPLYKTNRQTVTDYFQLLQIPYIAENVYQYRRSFVKRENERKTYFADNGFISLISIAEDFGKLMENLVFNFLNRHHDSVYYYKTFNNLEVDFLVSSNSKMQLFQVSYDVSDNLTREREVKALFKAMQELELKTANLITYNEKDVMQSGELSVHLLPFWELAIQ